MGTIDGFAGQRPSVPLTLLQQMSTGLPQTGGVMGIAYVNRADRRENQ